MKDTTPDRATLNDGRGAGHQLTAALLVAAAAVASCGSPAISAAQATSSSRVPTTVLRPSTSSPAAEPPKFLRSEYGVAAVQTEPNASCTLRISVDAGALGDGPPARVDVMAGPDGVARWSYPSPLVPAGIGRHDVTCAPGDRVQAATSTFPVALKILRARALTVRIHGIDIGAGMSPLAGRLEPSLVPLREADVARLEATLESDWKLATRGLGSLTVVGASADVVIEVVPARGTSQQLAASDGTTRIFIVVDDGVLTSPEYIVTTALHELGHLWCCYGAGAGPDGHWLLRLPDPTLGGIDEFGLMTQSVTCHRDGAALTCPRRFSERELRELGLTTGR